MSTNVSNFLFVVLIYSVITSTFSIRISTNTKVKQDLLVSDNFVQKSLKMKDIICTQDEWKQGVSYPAGSTIKHNNRLFEASAATLEEPLCDKEEDCSDANNWKFITNCLPQESGITITSNADANTELCGESRESREEDKKDGEEINKKIEDEIKDNTTPTPTPIPTPTPEEETKKDPDTKGSTSTGTNTGTKSVVISDSKASSSTSGNGISTSTGSLDDLE